jgi:hypothetical protein
MKTAPTNKKIREIIALVRETKLIPRPEFQRRLVWNTQDKNHFLDSVLKGYPFPEIYVADGDVDLTTGQGTQLLVDGLQRVTTLVQYFDEDPALKLTLVQRYQDLSDDDKRNFLQYDIAVRDLGSVSRQEIIEVFKRINATHYSLNDIEVNNAVYAGALKTLAETLSFDPVFTDHRVFNAKDYKRMGDLRFVLSILITMLDGYFNRDEQFEEYLERFNDEFPLEREIEDRFKAVVDFLDECGFEEKSRIWRKADLFTAFVELDRLLNGEKIPLDPGQVVERVQALFAAIDHAQLTDVSNAGVYYKAALQASNDRLNRVRRGIIMDGTIRGVPSEEIMKELVKEQLIS